MSSTTAWVVRPPALRMTGASPIWRPRSRGYYAQLTQRGDHTEALAVMMHEFGHMFGLDHVDSPRELMYDGNNDTATYGPGDLEGRRRLGQGPCL